MIVEYVLVPSIASEHDVQAVSAALSALPGVLLVTVSRVDRRVRVQHTGRVHVDALIQALSAAGYAQVALLA